MAIYQKNLNGLIKRALKFLEVPERPPLSDWADENFYLSPESSGEQGMWKCLPYQIEILNEMGNDTTRKVVMKKSARTGYTKMIMILTAYYIKVLQRSMFIAQPKDGDATDFSKDEITPMIRDVRCLKGLVKTSRLDSTHLKKPFVGGVLDIIGVHSAKNLRRLTKDLGIFDEIDAYGLTEEGCPIGLGEKRMMASSFPKYIYGSTCTYEGSNIDARWENSDKRRFYVPCPHCDKEQYLVWKEEDMDHGLAYEVGNPNNAYYICKHCACAINEKSKWEMIKQGRWIAENPFEGIAGFHIWAAYSPYPNTAWTELAKEHKDALGNNEDMRVFYNTILGENYEEEGEGKLDWELLYNRREHYQLDVPDDVIILTVGIDTQDDRFEWEVIGWGYHEESWGIDYGVLHGDLRKPEIWNLLAEKMRKTYKKADGTILNISFGCFDQGGHFSDQVNQFSRMIGEKFIIPIFGAKNPAKPIANFPAKKNSKGTYRMEVGVSAAKDVWNSRYKLQTPGASYCHYPVKECYNETYFRGAVAEFKKSKEVGGVKVWRWHCNDGVRNEPTDCRGYALAAIRVLQQNFGVSLQPEEQKQVKRQRSVRRLT